MEERKEKLLKAKSLVIQGATLKEASEETDLSIDILKKHSSKENWIKLQKEFFQEMYIRLQIKNMGKHIKRVEKTIDNLNIISERTMKDFEVDKIAPDKAVNVVITSIRGQGELLGVMKAEDFIKLKKAEITEETAKGNYTITEIRKKYNLN